MAKKSILCSLRVLNLKNISRVISGQILSAKDEGTIHFHGLKHVEDVLTLHANNHVQVKTEIPEHIKVRLTDQRHLKAVEDISNPSKKSEEQEQQEVSVTTDQDKVVEPSVEEVEPILEETKQEEVVEPSAEEKTEELKEEQPAEEKEELPKWYKSIQQLEEMTRKDILTWASEIEDLKISASKTAEEVTEIAQDYIAKKFPHHNN